MLQILMLKQELQMWEGTLTPVCVIWSDSEQTFPLPLNRQVMHTHTRWWKLLDSERNCVGRVVAPGVALSGRSYWQPEWMVFKGGKLSRKMLIKKHTDVAHLGCGRLQPCTHMSRFLDSVLHWRGGLSQVTPNTMKSRVNVWLNHCFLARSRCSQTRQCWMFWLMISRDFS